MNNDPSTNLQPQPIAQPIKQSNVKWLTNITIFSGVQALLEWSSDNHVKLYVAQNGQWMLEFDVPVQCITKAIYVNGTLGLKLQPGMARYTDYSVMFGTQDIKAELGSTVSHHALKMFGAAGAIASVATDVALANNAAVKEAETDALWWVATLKNFGIMKQSGSFSSSDSAKMLYIIYGIAGGVLLLVMIIVLAIALAS